MYAKGSGNDSTRQVCIASRDISRQILELFKRLNKELEQTIVMVTHEDWHKEYTNRFIYLKDGLI